eukprot:gnl/Spiro4/18083_TR9660_c0_g1_i1.p1 gnl/Spiro4/18083_TR9660_c0_g1~~gnl/Spiro4/18083_TR9660_c0_g1_i1.p1  ORF type:complete len:300 (+),score=78.97 gnl/Spiro4/18083_TR9660_c0_g1_i1:51-902(+)
MLGKQGLVCVCVAVLALASFASASMSLASCRATSIWVTIPVPRDTVHSWLAGLYGPATDTTISLGDISGLGYPDNTHPIQLEFDSFVNCSTLFGLPYPGFEEIAVQVPYTTWSNTTTHLQPFALVSALAGSMAMTLMQAEYLRDDSSSSKYPLQFPATWSQTASLTKGPAEFAASAQVSNVLPSADLAQHNAAWNRTVAEKKQNEVVRCSLTKHFACNRIEWDFTATSVAPLTDGQLTVAVQGALSSLFPLALVNNSFAQLAQDFPGFQAFAVWTNFHASLGC